MLAHAVMTATLDRYLQSELTCAHTVSQGRQHLWAAVCALRVQLGHLPLLARQHASSVLRDTKMLTQMHQLNARCSEGQLLVI